MLDVMLAKTFHKCELKNTIPFINLVVNVLYCFRLLELWKPKGCASMTKNSNL